MCINVSIPPGKDISNSRKVSLCYVQDLINNLNIKCIKCLGGSKVGGTVNALDDRIKIQYDLNNLKKIAEIKVIKRAVPSSSFRFIAAWEMDMGQVWQGCQVNVTRASRLSPLGWQVWRESGRRDQQDGAPTGQIFKNLNSEILVLIVWIITN